MSHGKRLTQLLINCQNYMQEYSVRQLLLGSLWKTKEYYFRQRADESLWPLAAILRYARDVRSPRYGL